MLIVKFSLRNYYDESGQQRHFTELFSVYPKCDWTNAYLLNFATPEPIVPAFYTKYIKIKNCAQQKIVICFIQIRVGVQHIVLYLAEVPLI